jgi:hypothetical protein
MMAYLLARGAWPGYHAYDHSKQQWQFIYAPPTTEAEVRRMVETTLHAKPDKVYHAVAEEPLFVSACPDMDMKPGRKVVELIKNHATLIVTAMAGAAGINPKLVCRPADQRLVGGGEGTVSIWLCRRHHPKLLRATTDYWRGGVNI